MKTFVYSLLKLKAGENKFSLYKRVNMSMNKIMSKQLNHGYNIQKMSNKIKQEPVVKMSVGKKILNWFKSKFSRFVKKADEFVDKFID